MPKPTKTTQTKSLERIQSELWQLERVSEETISVNTNLTESVDTLSTGVGELIESVDDLKGTVKEIVAILERELEKREETEDSK